MNATVRTRFAPSPTGPLHLGNARTAILNWLFARHAGGAFVLRLEDTDTARNVSGGEEAIREALDWLGLERDEGPERGGPFSPYRQSERGARHEARARELLDTGRAFRCFCTPAELEADRDEAIAAGRPPGVDRRCRALPPAGAAAREAAGEPAAIRLRVEPGPVSFEDRLKGELSIDGADLGDFVLLRPDGRATYNFAAAVDDLDMRISHVIRGVGHLSNTPKQVLLYEAFDAPPPQFVHIPTVLARGGGKLSKREGARGVLEYRDEGYHPDAIVNYLSLLSWSSGTGTELFTRDALVEAIDLDRIGATDAELDPDKMRWLSGQHVRAESPERLARRWAEFGCADGLDVTHEDLVRAAEVFAKRTELLSDARPELESVYGEPDLAAEAASAALADPAAPDVLEHVLDAWRDAEWTPATLKASLRGASEAAGVAGRRFYQPIRAALTGAAHGPDLGEVAYALGRERTRTRLERTRTHLERR